MLPSRVFPSQGALQMKSALALLVFLVPGIAAGGAQANGGLYLTADYNSAKLTLTGDQNALSVDQTFDGLGGPNLLSVDISGNSNGGPSGAAFGTSLAVTGLAPGLLVQTGHDNSISVTVAGSQNLFAAAQVGSHNELTGTVIGNNNQAAVLQSGSGNTVSFVQNGNGNSLTVIQRSY
jgi:hypothetical protein